MDDLVKSAIAHWAPRFVANGVALTDFEEVTAGDRHMGRLVPRVVGQGRACTRRWGARRLRTKKFISAGEHLQRAGVYYHFGKFLFVHDVPQMKAAHMKAVECRNLALPHLDPPGERVTIPYEGKALYGILRKPKGVTSRRCWSWRSGSTPPRKRPTPTSGPISSAASRRWCSTDRGRARANTISRSAATMRSR